jgi:catechol 2,3-dioxygenase-like lactoylglutathione lyase family enzyme
MSGLGRHRLVAFVGATQLARATQFYVGTLGLRLVAREAHAVVLDAAGTMLRLTATADHVPARHTVLGWDVDDIERTAGDLRGVGVRFERFEFLEQDERAIWTAPDGTKVAWFRDPDGNLLSITQFP